MQTVFEMKNFCLQKLFIFACTMRELIDSALGNDR